VVADAPVVVPYVPAAQPVQVEVLSTGVYWPELQKAHVEEPTLDASVPTGQLVQLDDKDAPVVAR